MKFKKQELQVENNLVADVRFLKERLGMSTTNETIESRLAAVEGALNQRGMLKSPDPPAPGAPILELTPHFGALVCRKCLTAQVYPLTTEALQAPAVRGVPLYRPGDPCPKCSSPKIDLPRIKRVELWIGPNRFIRQCPVCKSLWHEMCDASHCPAEGDPCPKCNDGV